MTRNAAFGGKARPALYALAMFVDDTCGQPPSNAFEVMPGERLRSSRKAAARCVSLPRDSPVPPKGLNGPPGGTRQSAGEDKPVLQAVPSNVSTKQPKPRKTKRIWQSRMKWQSSRKRDQAQL